MNFGIIGLPKSGKTTIFNALTGLDAEVTDYESGKVEPNVAVVDVGDERVDRLSAMYEPKKTIYATMEFIDFVGGGTKGDGLFSGEGMALVKTADAMLVVLRNFANPTLDQSFGTADPLRDLSKIQSELVIADLIVVEKRLKRLEGDHARGKKTPQSLAEERLMRRLFGALEEETFIRTLELSAEDRTMISGFRFLTAKPALILLNSSEDRFGKNAELVAQLEALYPVIEFAGNFEMELSKLDEQDAAAFMEDMGIGSSARTRLTGFAYRLLGYLSFFTVGKDEVRAWTIRQGETAVDAAGTIHSDLAKGFIRAECFTYYDLIELGSEKAVKDKGRFRLEGKDYIVTDGDILHIRFNI